MCQWNSMSCEQTEQHEDHSEVQILNRTTRMFQLQEMEEVWSLFFTQCVPCGELEVWIVSYKNQTSFEISNK